MQPMLRSGRRWASQSEFGDSSRQFLGDSWAIPRQGDVGMRLKKEGDGGPRASHQRLKRPGVADGTASVRLGGSESFRTTVMQHHPPSAQPDWSSTLEVWFMASAALLKLDL